MSNIILVNVEISFGDEIKQDIFRKFKVLPCIWNVEYISRRGISNLLWWDITLSWMIDI